jgi:long-chain acyl-CoA synthetase
VVHLPYSHTVARTLSTSAPLITGIVPHFGENTAEFAKTILEVRPTYWMAPPRFYQRFAAQLISFLGSRSLEERRAYALAMSIAKRVLRKRRRGQPLGSLLEGLDKVCRETVFQPLVAQVGLDQLREVFTASAPMPPELMTLWQLWGVELKEVYGQTETVGTLVAQGDPWPEPGNIGRPNPDPNWEVRINEDGEMIARGPSLFVGYLNKPDETVKTLRDGWLYTGDVVAQLPNGNLKLIDRKKDLINTAGGKSISPTQIENEIRESPYISEAVVIGEGRKYLTALIEVDFATTAEWTRSKGFAARSYAELASSDDVIRLIETEIGRANARMARAEQIKTFRLLPEELTPESGLMTPTRKKKRKQINDHYGKLIDSMYDDTEEKLILKAIA